MTASAGTQSDVGFQGGRTDPATGDVETASRWYDPAAGDFTSHDTVTNNGGNGASANPYAYADDDPLDNTDSSGQSACGVSGSRSKAPVRGRGSAARSNGDAHTGGRSSAPSSPYNPYSALYNT